MVGFVAAKLAAADQLLVVAVVAISLGPGGIVHSLSAIGQGHTPLSPVVLVTGLGAAFLAFSGLERVAQLAPAMRAPRSKSGP